jgi:hypothetical protein
MFKNIKVTHNGRQYDVSISIHPSRAPYVAGIFCGERVTWEKVSGKQPGPTARAILDAEAVRKALAA